MKIKTIEPIIIDSAFVGPKHTEAEYEAQTLHWLYLWKLEGLNLPTEYEPIKLGIAKQIYRQISRRDGRRGFADACAICKDLLTATISPPRLLA